MSEQETPHATVSTQLLWRVVIILIALWDSVAGLVLLAFHGASTGALGAGLEDRAAQRLLGVHLLILVPVYLHLAWRPDRYQGLLWLPFAAEAGVALAIGYNMLVGETGVGDGLLAFAVSLIFSALLAFLWITEQRTVARIRAESDAEGQWPPPESLPPGGPPAER